MKHLNIKKHLSLASKMAPQWEPRKTDSSKVSFDCLSLSLSNVIDFLIKIIVLRTKDVPGMIVYAFNPGTPETEVDL